MVFVSNKCFCLKVCNKIGQKWRHAVEYHYWSELVSAIIGANQFLPLLVQTSFYHYWCKPVSTITSANQFLPLLVQTSFYCYWCKPVSTVIGANQFLPLLVQNGFIQNWHIRFCHGWYTYVPCFANFGSKCTLCSIE